MLTFNTFRCNIDEEKVNKGGHISHLEDGMFEDGYEGLLSSIVILKDVAKSLSPASGSVSSVNISTKWDGAPAVLAGINPENGKFFVATKSFFNKEPKINYTEADIKKNHEGGLVPKLIDCLKYLKSLNIRGMAWGDVLFSQADKKTETIDGKSYITFRPNTITYAVPTDSPVGGVVKAAKFGVVFHTKFTGSTMAAAVNRANWSAGTVPMGTSTAVWMPSAKIPTLPKSSPAMLQEPEIKQMNAMVAKIESDSKSAKSALDTFLKNPAGAYVSVYINSVIRTGAAKSSTKSLSVYIETKLNGEISALKKEDSKAKKIKTRDDILKFLKAYESQIDKLFALHTLITAAKGVLITKLAQTQSVSTFVAAGGGYKPSAPEGFVAACGGSSCKIVKLVDRREFSANNFNIAKTW